MNNIDKIVDEQLRCIVVSSAATQDRLNDANAVPTELTADDINAFMKTLERSEAYEVLNSLNSYSIEYEY